MEQEQSATAEPIYMNMGRGHSSKMASVSVNKDLVHHELAIPLSRNRSQHCIKPSEKIICLEWRPFTKKGS
jgi:hypothetical protein